MFTSSGRCGCGGADSTMPDSGFSFFSPGSSDEDTSRIWLERASTHRQVGARLGPVLAPQLVELRQLVGLHREAAALPGSAATSQL